MGLANSHGAAVPDVAAELFELFAIDGYIDMSQVRLDRTSIANASRSKIMRPFGLGHCSAIRII